MFLVLYLNYNCEFNVSLHPNFAAAEAAFANLLRKFILAPGETLPPKSSWAGLCDSCGEGVRIF